MVKNSIGNLLIKSSKIRESQLDAALEVQKKSKRLIGEAIIDLGFATPEDIALALSEQLNIPYIELGDDFRIKHEDTKLIPEAVARRYCLVPFKSENGAITIVMKDPLDIEAIDTVRRMTALEVNKGINTEENILSVIDKYYTEEAHIERKLQDILDVETGKTPEAAGPDNADSDQLRIRANDAPVVRFVNLILLQAIRDRASDIHFEPAEQEIVIRMRIDGILKKVTPPSKSLYAAIVTRVKILSNMDITERRLPQDGRFKFKIHDRVIDVRVSSLPEACGEKLVLRILDRQALILSMEDIGMEPDMLKRFQAILKSPYGIILLTGPTGSGKTTTLYSALNFAKSTEENIQTVEDPIEYLIEGINQMQIKPGIGLTFASSLRSILRQDPDVIMIGEIRDLDTAQIAIRASLTGHLVMSTLHTNDSVSAFNRLKDIGVETYLIAATSNLVISQRLVRVICEHCRERVRYSSEYLKPVRSISPDADSWDYYRGKGCKVCHNTGYLGRIGIFEFLEVVGPLKEMIVKGMSESELRNKAGELGMISLLANGLNKVKRGVTTIEEVLSVCALS